MTVNIEHQNPVQAKLKIQVPAPVVTQKLKDYFAALATRANVPGFRPGKAPPHVVKQMYGQDAVADLSERLIAEFLGKAVDEHQLDLVIPPTLLATDLPTESKPFNFEVEVHLKPKIGSINLSGLKVEVEKPKAVTNEEVETELQTLREMDASYTDITDDRAATVKDCVVVSYTGTVDGVAQDGMKAEMQTAILGQNRFLPDFEKGIIGLKKGETKTFPVAFPENYHEASLHGKTAEFTLTLNGIKEKVLPELTDEFAAQAEPTVKTVDELRAKIRAQLESNHASASEKQKRDLLGDLLVEKNPMQLSPRHLEQVTQRYAEQTHHMMHQMGIAHEETEEHAKSLMDSAAKKAERDLKLTYILEAIAKEQKFEVTSDDVKARMEATAKKTGYSLSQIQSYYAQKDEDESVSRLDRLKVDIQDEKSLDYALSKATIKLKD